MWGIFCVKRNIVKRVEYYGINFDYMRRWVMVTLGVSICFLLGIVMMLGIINPDVFNRFYREEDKKMTRKGALILCVASFVSGFIVLGISSISTDKTETTSSTVQTVKEDTHKADEEKLNKANQYAQGLKGNVSKFSIGIYDAKLNDKIEGQLWIQIPNGHSDDQLITLGKEISRDYYHTVGYLDSDVIIVDGSQMRVEVIFYSIKGNYEVKLK